MALGRTHRVAREEPSGSGPCLLQHSWGRSIWEHRRAQQVGTRFVFFPGHLEYLHRLAPTQTAQQPHHCVAESKPGKGPRNQV